jgi:hypothetical protein
MLEAAQIIALLTAALLVAAILASARLLVRMAVAPGLSRSALNLRGVGVFRLFVGATCLSAIAAALAVASGFMR